MSISCKLCNKDACKQWSGTILSKYAVQYFFCDACEFLFTEDPYWLLEAYSSPIAAMDTGLLMRNNKLVSKVACIIHFFLNRHAQYLDYAGGYGVLTRLMRDVGYDFYWSDPYAQNLFARGFEHHVSASDLNTFELVTSFESLEHFVNPVAELEKIFSLGKNALFTTGLLPDPIPKIEEWWYYTPMTGQHIAFYRKKTLQLLANRFNKHLVTFGDLHFFSEKPVSDLSYRRVLKYAETLFKYVVQRNLQSKTFADFKKIAEGMCHQ